jgi:hypothetical protein
MHITLWLENLTAVSYFESISVDTRIILKCTLKEKVIEM